MSGIAGILHLDGRPVDGGLLRQMVECVPHRGGDGVDVWIRRSVGLAHRQLCSTEESLRESQPASNAARSCWVTFDGRIDNRGELIARLHADPTLTDVELMLHAYERWDTGCLEWLIGDFAFALWDAAERRLFCGRDPYGIRPFYYHRAGPNFVFGSEIRQILQSPEIPLTVSEEAVAEWFTAAGLHSVNYRDQEQTFFRGIRELPAAHFLTLNGEGLRITRYWKPDPKREVRYRDKQEYFNEFAHLFSESVRCRLRAVGPVGAELSGGLDSSSIVCVSQQLPERQAEHRLITFSMVFDELTCDERPLIRSVVDRYGLEHCPVLADHLCGFSNLEPEAREGTNIDHPDQFALQKAGELLYRAAHERGVRVMLSGEGAENHVMGGEYVFDSLIRGLRWAEACSRLSVIGRTSSWRSCAGSLLRYGLAPLLPGNLSWPLYLKWFHPEFKQERFPSFYSPSLCSLIQTAHARQKARLESFPVFRSWGQQLEYENLNPASSLFRSFGQPVERRFPYHDRRLVEYCLAIPPEIKYRHLPESSRRYVRGRVLQREAFRNVLPESIRQSGRKVNFNDLYQRRFLEAASSLKKLFAPPVVPRVSAMGFLDGTQFWRNLSEILAAVETSRPVNPARALLVNRIVQLELWLRALESVDAGRQTACLAHDDAGSSTRQALVAN